MKLYITIAFLFCANLKSLEWLFAHSYQPDLSIEDYLYPRYEIVPKNVECLPHNPPGLVTKPVIPFSNITQSAMGQEQDIQVIIDRLKDEPENVKFVGVGVEKGASTWINAATYNEIADRLQALVLDTPYADINDAICEATYFDYIPGGKFIIKKVAKFLLGHYNPDGIQPIDAIEHIKNKKLPIFIIHARYNVKPSINHARILYIQCKECGFENVYLVENKHGSHHDILSTAGYRLYQQTLHKFYRKFGIPHNKNLFAKHIKIKNYQPDVNQVIARMQVSVIEKYRTTIVKTIILLYIAYLCNRYYPNFARKITGTILFFINIFKSGRVIT